MLAEQPFPMGSTLAKEPGAPSASIRTSRSLSTARSGLSLGAQGPQPYLPGKQQTQQRSEPTAQHAGTLPLSAALRERVGGAGVAPRGSCLPVRP